MLSLNKCRQEAELSGRRVCWGVGGLHELGEQATATAVLAPPVLSWGIRLKVDE